MKKTKERLMREAKEMLDAMVEADVADKKVLKELRGTVGESILRGAKEALEYAKKDNPHIGSNFDDFLREEREEDELIECKRASTFERELEDPEFKRKFEEEYRDNED